MELSKAQDCLSHDILLANLSAYGFDEPAITLIANYLSNRYQHVNVGSTFISYLEILRGVLQVSILGSARGVLQGSISLHILMQHNK